MDIDILILNTAVLDLRSSDFGFVRELSGPGGLSMGKTEDMPDFSDSELEDWINGGGATAGGPGNCAPLMVKAGLNVAVGGYVGRGGRGGLDIQGRIFVDTLDEQRVDTSEIHTHPSLPTGTAFIHDAEEQERGAIVYFPNANNDFDFEHFKGSVERLDPAIVYYMYSGLSSRGDANGGQDLADFIKWCRSRGKITIIDSHTLAPDPQKLIREKTPVDAYKLLTPILPEADLFFTSTDEAKMIENTLGEPQDWAGRGDSACAEYCLDQLCKRGWKDAGRTRLFGITLRNGACEKHLSPDGSSGGPNKVESRFMEGEVVDLVGAGDSFRTGVLCYISKKVENFRDGSLDFAEAIQMGNLVASLYIKAPLNDRYGCIRDFEELLAVVRQPDTFHSLLGEE